MRHEERDGGHRPDRVGDHLEDASRSSPRNSPLTPPITSASTKAITTPMVPDGEASVQMAWRVREKISLPCPVGAEEVDAPLLHPEEVSGEPQPRRAQFQPDEA